MSLLKKQYAKEIEQAQVKRAAQKIIVKFEEYLMEHESLLKKGEIELLMVRHYPLSNILSFNRKSTRRRKLLSKVGIWTKTGCASVMEGRMPSKLLRTWTEIWLSSWTFLSSKSSIELTSPRSKRPWWTTPSVLRSPSPNRTPTSFRICPELWEWMVNPNRSRVFITLPKDQSWWARKVCPGTTLTLAKGQRVHRTCKPNHF